MKKSKSIVLMACIISSSLFFSSCIGSFSLFNHLKAWNQKVGDKFVNELIFFAMHIIPIYEVAYISDALVLNAIEFWTGANPLANVGEVKKVKGENGEYLITNLKDGYHIEKVGEKISIELKYNENDQTWNVVSEGKTNKLIKLNNNGTANLFLPNNQQMNVVLNAQGMMAAHQILDNRTFLVAR